jgi:hypothetical protein
VPIVATFVLPELHLSVWLFPDGVAIAFNGYGWSLTDIVLLFGLSVIVIVGTVTVKTNESCIVLSPVYSALIDTVPCLWAVIMPVVLTVATLVSSDTHLNGRFVGILIVPNLSWVVPAVIVFPAGWFVINISRVMFGAKGTAVV